MCGTLLFPLSFHVFLKLNPRAMIACLLSFQPCAHLLANPLVGSHPVVESLAFRMDDAIHRIVESSTRRTVRPTPPGITTISTIQCGLHVCDWFSAVRAQCLVLKTFRVYEVRVQFDIIRYQCIFHYAVEWGPSLADCFLLRICSDSCVRVWSYSCRDMSVAAGILGLIAAELLPGRAAASK